MSQTNDEYSPPSFPGTPRWVRLLGVIALILVVLVGVMLLSGGEHGPGRHMPLVSVTEGLTPPVSHQGQHP